MNLAAFNVSKTNSPEPPPTSHLIALKIFKPAFLNIVYEAAPETSFLKAKVKASKSPKPLKSKCLSTTATSLLLYGSLKKFNHKHRGTTPKQGGVGFP